MYYPQCMKKTKKILAINFGGIGDEILFLPTLISLKKEFSDSEITLVTESRSAGIKDLTDKIDKIITADIKTKNKYIELLKLIIKARFNRYDMVVSSGASPFISVILFLTGIRKRYGYNTGALSKKLLTQAVQLNKNQYACAMYHDLITPITTQKTELPEITLEEKTEVEKNTVLIHPGVSKMSVKKGCIKTINADVWAKVIDILLQNGKKVILTGGPDDKTVVDEIKKLVKNPDNSNFVDMYGKTKNLKELAILISKYEIFLCSDSAPLHVAVALNKKTFPIFGPTNYKTLIPQNENVIPILADDNCKIKPCLWERRQTSCEGLDCLKISPEKIAQLVEQN